MDRRNFLKTGIISSGLVVVPAILTSCDIVDSEQSKTDATNDIVILKKAAEMENVAFASYKAAAGLLSSANLATAIAFRDHHTLHFTELNRVLVEDFGVSAVEFDSDKAPDPRVLAVTNEIQALQLAAQLELEASEAYFASSTGVLVTTAARKILVNILPMELQHHSYLKAALQDPYNITAFFKSL